MDGPGGGIGIDLVIGNLVAAIGQQTVQDDLSVIVVVEPIGHEDLFDMDDDESRIGDGRGGPPKDGKSEDEGKEA